MLLLGYNKVTLAKKIGLTESAIRRWQREGFGKAKLDNIKNLCRVLSINPLVFLGKQDIKITRSYDELEQLFNKGGNKTDWEVKYVRQKIEKNKKRS